MKSFLPSYLSSYFKTKDMLAHTKTHQHEIQQASFCFSAGRFASALQAWRATAGARADLVEQMNYCGLTSWGGWGALKQG